MGVVGQRHAPAAVSPWNRKGTLCTGSWMDLGAGLRGSRKSRPPPPGFELRTVQPLAIHYGRNLYEGAVVAVRGFLCSFRRKARKTEVLDFWRVSGKRRGRKISHCVWKSERWQAKVFHNTGWLKKMNSILYVYISWTIHGMWMIYITFERGGPKFWNTTARALA